MQSIRQLREICQCNRDDEFYQACWLDRNILRKISIYPTWFFLKLGLSPNKLTLGSLLPGIAAGALFTLPQAEYWLLAWGLLFVYEILDCCDGEIARYQGSTSLVGEHNEEIIGKLLYPFLFACMSFGIYRALGSAIVFIFGFAIVIGLTLYQFSPVLCQTILYRKGLLHEQIEQAEQLEFSQMQSRGIIPYIRMLFNQTSVFFALLIIPLLDMFVSPFSIRASEFNVRFIYLAVYALTVVAGSLLRVYDVNKRGVRLYK